MISRYPKYTHLPRPGRLPLSGRRYDVERCKKALEAWSARGAPVEKAVDHLNAWRESLLFVQLFEKYFPHEYADAARRPKAWRLDAHSRIAPIEQQFFELADARLFPFNTDWMEMTLDEIRHGEDYVPSIPLYAVTPRPDEWEASEQEFPVIQVLLCFSWNNFFAPDEGAHCAAWRDVAAHFAQRGVQLPKPFRYPWNNGESESALAYRLHRCWMELHTRVFFEMARAVGLNWLQTTLRVLYRETNNVLVDLDEEMMYEPLEWTQDNLDWLREEWIVGRQMLDTFWQSLKRIQQQPELGAHLIGLWNASWECALSQLRSPHVG